MCYLPTADCSIRPGDSITDVNHEAAARAPTRELDARQALQNPVRRRARGTYPIQALSLTDPVRRATELRR